MPHVQLVDVDTLKASFALSSTAALRGRFVLCEGDLHIPGALFLDWERGWHSGDVARQCGVALARGDAGAANGLCVLGNLRVNGAIVNKAGDTGASLLVGGRVDAQSLVGGGSFIDLRGDVQLRECLYGHYNDGMIVIDGNLSALIFIRSDHFIDVRKGIEVTHHFDDVRDREAALPGKMKAVLAPRFHYWQDLLRALEAGESVLARADDSPADVASWVQQVWKNPKVLRKVPDELRTESFYLQLFARDCPIPPMEVAELVAKLKKKEITEKICIALLSIAPLSFLRLPNSMDLQALYERCFLQTEDAASVFEEIPASYRSAKMQARVDAPDAERTAVEKSTMQPS